MARFGNGNHLISYHLFGLAMRILTSTKLGSCFTEVNRTRCNNSHQQSVEVGLERKPYSTTYLACVADETKPRYSPSANQRPKACSLLPGFSIIGSYWLLRMAVLSCTVIGRVAWNHGYANGYVLDEYQIHKINTTVITELPGEA